MASSYIGVSWRKDKNAWKVMGSHNGNTISLRNYATEMEAARKYDEWAMQIPGKPLNFPGSRPKRKIADLREKVYSTVRQNLIEDCKKEMAFKTAPEFLSFCDAFSGSKKGSSVTTSLGSGGFSAIDDDEVRWLQENGISFTANNEKAKRPPPRDRSKQPPRRRPLISSSSTASSLSSQPSTLESRRVQKAPLQKKRKRGGALNSECQMSAAPASHVSPSGTASDSTSLVACSPLLPSAWPWPRTRWLGAQSSRCWKLGYCRDWYCRN